MHMPFRGRGSNVSKYLEFGKMRGKKIFTAFLMDFLALFGFIASMLLFSKISPASSKKSHMLIKFFCFLISVLSSLSLISFSSNFFSSFVFSLKLTLWREWGVLHEMFNLFNFVMLLHCRWSLTSFFATMDSSLMLYWSDNLPRLNPPFNSCLAAARDEGNPKDKYKLFVPIGIDS